MSPAPTAAAAALHPDDPIPSRPSLCSPQARDPGPRRSDPASPRARSSRGALWRGQWKETALPPAAEAACTPRFTQTKAGLGSSPPSARDASLGKELLKKTLQMQRISEEKGREVKTRGVCVCAHMRVLHSVRHASLRLVGSQLVECHQN